MKKQIAGIALFTATVAAVALYPTWHTTAATKHPVSTVPTTPYVDPIIAGTTQQRPQIELVFVLDTTSSMSGFIQAAKEKIWSIATTMASAQPAPAIKIGLVAFRDRGDAYVTQVIDLSSDLDSMYAKLMEFEAVGGGDGPESVNEALYDAVHQISWSEAQSIYKVVFLVGDAPPHMDYKNDVHYPMTLKVARDNGIDVNTILSGNDLNTAEAWRSIASLGAGDFMNVGSDGNAVAVATPFDDDIANLSRELDDTRLYFGARNERSEKKRKQELSAKALESASVSSRARRGAFNSSASGKDNFLGDKELVAAYAAGTVDIETMDEALLPESLQALPAEEREPLIQKQVTLRAELQKKIRTLTEQRDGFISEKVAAEGGADDSLDHKVYDAVRRQAASKGLIYKAAPKY